MPLPEQEPVFTVYDDIRQKLIAQGMPADQIAFIHEANTEVRKKELFSKVRTGQVRVLLGSTAKMGAGTNVQDRLVALHDLDCPWRPGDLAQRKGRIERQGNQNPLVHVYRYVTEGTFDAYLWQTVENKQKFISQIMTSKSPVRSCDDVDETALSSLARHMEVSKPSVCHAVATLRDGGFLMMDEDHFLHLTDVGREVAEKIYERHCFFTEQLIAAGVDPKTAEADACRIEHIISDESFVRLKEAAAQEQEQTE